MRPTYLSPPATSLRFHLFFVAEAPGSAQTAGSRP
jgi:hypothetical protein